jgi:hypothetical protein
LAETASAPILIFTVTTPTIETVWTVDWSAFLGKDKRDKFRRPGQILAIFFHFSTQPLVSRGSGNPTPLAVI